MSDSVESMNEVYQKAYFRDFLFDIDKALGLLREGEGVVFDENGNLFLSESIDYESVKQKIDKLRKEKNYELFVRIWRIPGMIRELKISPTATLSDKQNGYLLVFKHDNYENYSRENHGRFKANIPDAQGKWVLEKMRQE